jgi:DNA-binding XRE family transcriptional regulator
MLEYSVYILIGPRTDRECYVGIARDAESRFKQHLRGNDPSAPSKNQWVQELRSQGLSPVMRIVDQAIGRRQAGIKELQWMRVCSERGCSLLNVALPASRGLTSLAVMRSQVLKVTQEDLARRADLTLQTYRNAESGKNVTYTTATAILKALNEELQERSKQPVSLEQLGLNRV